MNSQLVYRKMVEQDIEGVLKIEEESFSLPWTRDSFIHEMTSNLHAYYVVALDSEEEIMYFLVFIRPIWTV